MCVHFVFLDESRLERFFILVQTTAIEILGYARGQQWAYLFNPFLWTLLLFLVTRWFLKDRMRKRQARNLPAKSNFVCAKLGIHSTPVVAKCCCSA